MLSGANSPVPAGTNINLSVEGALDWAHWGFLSATDFNHNSNVVQQISNVTLLGTGTVQRYTNLLHGYTWTNGTPTPGATNTTTAFRLTGLSNGFQISVPADPTRKRLNVYAGVFAATGRMQAALSDGSAANYVDTSLSNPADASNAVYMINFAAASTGQVLTVQFVADAVFNETLGGVTFQAATLMALPPNVPPSVTITNPVDGAQLVAPTNVAINAVATDTNGAVTKVEFFVNSTKVGEDTNSPFDFVWAATNAGTFTLTAVATDNEGATNVSSPVTVFVAPNTPPTVSLTAPANEAEFQAPTNITFSAFASDTNGIVSKVEFFVNSTKVGQDTSSPFNFSWAATKVGPLALTAVATDNGGLMTTSAPVTIFVTTNGGSLGGSVLAPTNTVDLTADGTRDWAHWGLTNADSFDHKAGVAQAISNFTIVGAGPTVQFADNFNGYSWSDGTPTPAITNTTTGVAVVGLSNGFEVMAPAGTNSRTLKLHVGTSGARGKLRAHLSDYSAAILTDFSVDNATNGPGGVYTLTYSAASTGQRLIARFTVAEMHDLAAGRVTLQAATLANLPPLISITSPTNDAQFTRPANIQIQTAASDPDGNITKVEFFSGAAKIGEATNTPFALTWANTNLGPFILTAVATDNAGFSTTSAPVTIYVTGMGGSLTGGVAAPPPMVDLTAEGTRDWAHWGLMNESSFDHKDVVSQVISNYALVGSGPVLQYDSGSTRFSWSDGTPTPAVNDTRTGIAVLGLGNGFEVTAPADTNSRTLKLYVGTYTARGRLRAYVSDYSAPLFTDLAIDSSNKDADGVYTLNYSAASAGKTLIARFTVAEMHDLAGGSVRLQAATLANLAPRISITSPADDSQNNGPTNAVIEVAASDPDGTVAKVEFFDAATKIGEATNAPFSFVWSPTNVGPRTLTAVATDDRGRATTSMPVSVFVTTSGGSLDASVISSITAVDLTAEGKADWAHWGRFTAASFDHKAGVVPLLNNFTVFGSSPAYQYIDNFNGYSWSDGTPTTGATNTLTGVFFVGVGNGFELVAPADTTTKTLKLYVGTFGARGRMRAYLTDYTAPIRIDSSIDNATNGPGGVYTFTYSSASAGKSLVIRYTVAESHDPFANVTLQAATLVTDNNPPMTGITSPANNAAFLAPADVLISAFASDDDGTIAKVEFFADGSKVGELTNAPYELLWTNVPLGRHTLGTRATDDRGLTYTSTNSSFHVGIGGGLLSGKVSTPPATVNLSLEGKQDWAHWGYQTTSSFDHLNSGALASGMMATIGSSSLLKRLTDSLSGYTWTNGAPPRTSIINNKTAVYMTGLSNGFQLTLPADTMRRKLRVYAGAFAARGRFEASLSDFSAPSYINSSVISVGVNKLGVFTLDFAAASAGQTLTIRYLGDLIYDSTFGNVTLGSVSVIQPGSPPLNTTWPGSDFNLSFGTDYGLDYFVEFTDSMAPTNWQPLTNFTGSGGLSNLIDPAAAALEERFYRIRVE